MNNWLKNIRAVLLYKIYFRILRRINAGRPELISGALDSILVIAPHPDDDVIGCGGILSKNRGKKIKVIFLTDGRYGGTSYKGDELVGIRKKEAINALWDLGISNVEFLSFEDGTLGDNIAMASAMLKDIYLWDNIFLPNILDNHQDHKAAALAVYGALSKVKNVKSKLWLYEIWTPVSPNVLVDITKEAQAKMAAINRHASQVKCYDYSEKILGLNAYRAISVPAEQNVRFCEGFCRCGYNDFKQMLNLI